MNAQMLEGLSEEQQEHAMKLVRDLEMKGLQKTFTQLNDIAFRECVTNFRGRTLEKSETKCLENVVAKSVCRCSSRFLAHFQRVNVRFGEEMMKQQQAMAAGAGPGGMPAPQR